MGARSSKPLPSSNDTAYGYAAIRLPGTKQTRLSTRTKARPDANKILLAVGFPETTITITTNIKIPPSPPASTAPKTFEFQNRPALKTRAAFSEPSSFIPFLLPAYRRHYSLGQKR